MSEYDNSPAHESSVDPHDTHPPGADAQSVRAGHEPDEFRTRTPLYVPMLVVGTVVSVFTIITVLFGYLVYAPGGKPIRDGNANQAGAESSKQDINTRFGTISSTDREAPTKAPRLEYLKQTATEGPNDPPYLRSKRPVESVGQTWEIRPEDLRPENFIDPLLKRKILIEAGYLDPDKKLAHIPIAEAMELLTTSKKLPVRKDALPLARTNDGRAKISNGGRTGLSQPEKPGEPGGKVTPTVPHQ